MKQNTENAHARKQRQRQQARTDTALRFKAECASLGLSAARVAKVLHVTPRTVHNWFSGRVRPPFVAVKLIRLMNYMELPGWDGWSFHNGQLWSPEGFAFKATDSTWWSLLVRQARCFRSTYEECRRLRVELAAACGYVEPPWEVAAARGGPAVSGHPGAAGVGLVTSINNVNSTVISCHYDHGLISCPPILSGSPTTSTSKRVSGLQPSASVSMASSALPSMPTFVDTLHLARRSSPIGSSKTSLRGPLVQRSGQSPSGQSKTQSQSSDPSQQSGSVEPSPSGINAKRSAKAVPISRTCRDVSEVSQ